MTSASKLMDVELLCHFMDSNFALDARGRFVAGSSEGGSFCVFIQRAAITTSTVSVDAGRTEEMTMSG